jgi:hypothetical protein
MFVGAGFAKNACFTTICVDLKPAPIAAICLIENLKWYK